MGPFHTTVEFVLQASLESISAEQGSFIGCIVSHPKNTPVSQTQANPPQAKPQAKLLLKTQPQAKRGIKLDSPSNEA